MRQKRVILMSLTVLGLACIGLFAWLNRSYQSAPIPGFAWIATTDGTTTNKTSRVVTVLASHGIPSCYDSMMVADLYVPTNQVAKARLVLTVEKLTFRGSVWSIH